MDRLILCNSVYIGSLVIGLTYLKAWLRIITRVKSTKCHDPPTRGCVF